MYNRNSNTNSNVNDNNNNVITSIKPTARRDNAMLNDDVMSLIFALGKDIEGLLKKEVIPFRQKIFEIALQYTVIAEQEKNVAKLLDLYFTIHTLCKLVIKFSINNVKDFHPQLINFLAARETILKGDSHDYCYTNSYANDFCYQIVSEFYPKQPVYNLLLNNAINMNRTKWCDPLNNEEVLPHPMEWFRTKENRIHLYEYVVEQAVENLKKHCDKLSDIWKVTDNADRIGKALNVQNSADVINVNDNNANNKVTDEAIKVRKFYNDLQILKQRTKTFKLLVEYSEFIAKQAENHKTIYSRLNDLRLALLKGEKKEDDSRQRQGRNGILGSSVNENKNDNNVKLKQEKDGIVRTGTEEEAGVEALQGVAEFAEWWNGLATIEGGKLLQDNIRAISAGRQDPRYIEYSNKKTLGQRLDYILNPAADSARDETNYNYCVEKQGEMIEEILTDTTATKAIDALESQQVTFWSNPYLETIKNIVLEELKLSQGEIDTGKNFFSSLANIPGFITGCKAARNANADKANSNNTNEDDKDVDLFRLATFIDAEHKSVIYRLFNSTQLAIILIEFINKNQTAEAMVFLQLIQNQANVKIDEASLLQAISILLSQASPDLKLLFKLCNTPNIFATQGFNGQTILQSAVAQFILKLRTQSNTKIKHAHNVIIFLLENFTNLFSKYELQNVLPSLLKVEQDELIAFILKLRPDVITQWPEDQIHPISYLLTRGLDLNHPLIVQLLETDTPLPLIDDDSKNALKDILRNSAATNNLELIEIIFDKFYTQHSINIFKDFVAKTTLAKQYSIINVFLTFANHEAYDAIFTSNLVEFIVCQLIANKQYVLANELLIIREDCIQDLNQVTDLITQIAKKHEPDLLYTLKRIQLYFLIENFTHDSKYLDSDNAESFYKEAIIKITNAKAYETIKYFLDFIDDKNFAKIFTKGLIAFIINQLNAQGEDKLAKEFLTRCPDCKIMIDDTKTISKSLEDLSSNNNNNNTNSKNPNSNARKFFNLFKKKNHDSKKEDKEGVKSLFNG